MCKLKLLILDGVKVLILCDIPSTLKVLHWKGCPMETLPFKNQHYELVEIDLTYSKIVQLWDRKKVLKSKLRQTPDLSGVPNLKTFHLGQCKELNYIHPSLAHRKSLVELYLWVCESLETLADKSEMNSLKKIIEYQSHSLQLKPSHLLSLS
ncbi:hypothetical protein S83_048465 [Arachis hypogaea]